MVFPTSVAAFPAARYAPPTPAGLGARSWPTARRRTASLRGNYPTDGDIHPLRLREEIKNFMQCEAILSVDGPEAEDGNPSYLCWRRNRCPAKARLSRCRSRSRPRRRSPIAPVTAKR
jgi:hypothetical protein